MLFVSFCIDKDVTVNVLLVKDGGRDVTDKSGVALRLKTDKNPSWHTSKPERTGPFQSEEFNDPAELLPEFLAKKHFQLPVQVLVRTFNTGFISLTVESSVFRNT